MSIIQTNIDNFNIKYKEYVRINNLLLELKKEIYNKSIKILIKKNKSIDIINKINPLTYKLSNNINQNYQYDNNIIQPKINIIFKYNDIFQRTYNFKIINSQQILNIYINQLNNISIINLGLSYYKLIKYYIIALIYIYIYKTNNNIFYNIFSFLENSDINKYFQKITNYYHYIENYNNNKYNFDSLLYKNELVELYFTIHNQNNIINTFDIFHNIKIKDMKNKYI